MSIDGNLTVFLRDDVPADMSLWLNLLSISIESSILSNLNLSVKTSSLTDKVSWTSTSNSVLATKTFVISSSSVYKSMISLSNCFNYSNLLVITPLLEINLDLVLLFTPLASCPDSWVNLSKIFIVAFR